MQLARLTQSIALYALLMATATRATPVLAPDVIPRLAIEPGAWRLAEVGAGGTVSAICLADVAPLLQLRHGDAQCTYRFIANTGRSTIANYACPGAGTGRTTMTLQTARAITVQTQGIADGAPFDVDYTAHRTGPC